MMLHVCIVCIDYLFFFFFFNDTATTEIYTLSLHDALPILIINPGARLSLQLHHQRSEHWVVVRGTARVTRGTDEFVLTADQSTYIPVNTRHRLENIGAEPLEIIEVQTGVYLGEDDIERFEDTYGRV